jgi:hypothetical protein
MLFPQGIESHKYLRPYWHESGDRFAMIHSPLKLNSLANTGLRIHQKGNLRGLENKDSCDSLRRRLFKFASDVVSEHRRSSHARLTPHLTLCQGCSVTFLHSLLVANYNLLSIRGKDVNSARLCSKWGDGGASRLPGSLNKTPIKLQSSIF